MHDKRLPEVKRIRRIFLIAAIVLFVASTLFGAILYSRVRRMMLTQIRSNAIDEARIAAKLIDPTYFTRIKPGDEGSVAYNIILKELALVRDSSNMEFLYTLRLNSDGQVVFWVDTDTEDPGKIGEVFEGTEAMYLALNGTPAAEEEPYKDRWGTHLSAYAPIKKGGDTVGVTAVDLNYTWVQREIRNVTLIVITLCIANYFVAVLLLLIVSQQMEKNVLKMQEDAKEEARIDLLKTMHRNRMPEEAAQTTPAAAPLAAASGGASTAAGEAQAAGVTSDQTPVAGEPAQKAVTAAPAFSGKPVESLTKEEALAEIKAGAPALFEAYRAFADILAPLKPQAPQGAAAEDLPEIDPDELAEMYEAIEEFAGMYDGDSIMNLIETAHTYRLPEADAEKINAIAAAVKSGNWDAVSLSS